MAEPSVAPRDLPPPILVEEEKAFGRLLEDLEGREEIAVDTEADSFFSYREKVCLIQVTVEDRDYLVDPLAGFDIGALGAVFADPDRTKVFHDGEYDVLILKRDYGFTFAGLFDTRIAAAALGETSPGLAAVLQKRFGVELDKSAAPQSPGPRATAASVASMPPAVSSTQSSHQVAPAAA